MNLYNEILTKTNGRNMNKNINLKSISKYFTTIFLFMLFTIPGLAQSSKYKPFSENELKKIVPSSTRLIYSLAGKWQKSFDESEWTNVILPASENHEERVVYKRTIKISSELTEQYNWQLYFLGIEDHVEVYVNSQFVGRYFGGMTPFYVKLPARMVKGGTNEVKLVVTPVSSTSRQIRAQNIFGHRIYTGLLREALLIGTPHIWIKDISYTTKLKSGGNAQINFKANISAGEIESLFKYGAFRDSLGTPGAEKLQVSLEYNLKRKDAPAESIPITGTRIITVERERTQDFNFNLNISSPKLWAPESPELYDLTVNLKRNGHLIDDFRIDVGFRDLRVSNSDSPVIYLNGKPLKIKGISYIEDIYSGGQTLNPAQMERDIRKIKTLGANLVRFKMAPPHPYLLSLCDKYGIMALVELPVYDVPAEILDMDEIKVRMKNISKRFVSSYSGNPSVIAWGISTGIRENTEPSERFNSQMIKTLKNSTDKLIYKVSYFGANESNLKDFDFVGYKPVREKYSFTDFKNEAARLMSISGKKPVIFLYGIAIQPKNHNGFSDPLSIESQAYYIRNSFHIVNELKAAGSIINNFNDYELNVPLLITNNSQRFVCSGGLVSRTRDQRLSYELLQTLFNAEKEPLLNAGSYNEETPVIFIITGIILGIILVFLINRFKRFREYLFRSVLRPYNFYADIRDQRIMSSVQTILLGLVISATAGIFLASIFYYYRTNILAEYLYMLAIPGSNLRELFFRLIWMPEFLLIFSTSLIFILAVISAFFIRIFAFFTRARIFYRDTLTITIWSAVPFLILLPVSIVLIRLLVYSDQLNMIVMAVMVLIVIWVLFRILKSTSVVFDIPSYKVYIVGLILIIFLVATVLSIYQYQFSLFRYIEYFLDVMLK